VAAWCASTNKTDLERSLRSHAVGDESYPVGPDEFRKLTTHRVRRADKDVSVSVPESHNEEEEAVEETTPGVAIRESIHNQALLA
jgi:hypothetical protein